MVDLNLETDSRYKEALSKLQSLDSQRDEARAALDGILSDLAGLETRKVDAEAEALIEGEKMDPAFAQRLRELHDKREGADHRVSVLERAVSLQRERVASIREELVTRLLPIARAEYEKALQRLAKALRAAWDAFEAERRTYQEIPGELKPSVTQVPFMQGVASGPVWGAVSARVSDPDGSASTSQAAAWLEACRRAGYAV